MHHACDQRFDVMGNLENFCELNKALLTRVQIQGKRTARKILLRPCSVEEIFGFGYCGTFVCL